MPGSPVVSDIWIRLCEDGLVARWAVSLGELFNVALFAVDNRRLARLDKDLGLTLLGFFYRGGRMAHHDVILVRGLRMDAQLTILPFLTWQFSY